MKCGRKFKFLSTFSGMGGMKHKKWQVRVKGLSKQQQLVDYCTTAFPVLGSKTAVRKAITAGRIVLNDKVVQEEVTIRNGDFILLKKEDVSKPKKKVTIEVPMVYEDDYLVVVNKPGGIAVNGNRNKTVENALAATMRPSTEIDALAGPTAAHRLDVPTKGLVVLAKTKSALIGLNRSFQEGKVKKEYVAIVHGIPPATGVLDTPIGGKPSRTEFETRQKGKHFQLGPLALVRLIPVTGRTHQLRIHLQQQGHLIAGDRQYARDQPTILNKGLYLASIRLAFTHPITSKPMDFKLPVPNRFLRLLR